MDIQTVQLNLNTFELSFFVPLADFYRRLCFNIDNALNSFDRIINDLNGYRNDTKASIQMFMKDHAMPVSKKNGLDISIKW